MRTSARRVFVGANFETAMKRCRFSQVGAPLALALLFFAGGVIIPSEAVAITQEECNTVANNCVFLCIDKDHGRGTCTSGCDLRWWDCSNDADRDASGGGTRPRPTKNFRPKEATNPGLSRPTSGGKGVPPANILDAGPGFSSQSPSGMSSPGAPAAPKGPMIR
jgi:hypothetical protein